MTANLTESLSRNLSNFPKVKTAFRCVGTEGNIPSQITQYKVALAAGMACLLQGRGDFSRVSGMLQVICTIM